MKKDHHIQDEETQIEALNIFENAPEISDEDIERLQTNPQLLAACKDLFSVKKAMYQAEAAVDMQTRYEAFVRNHRSYKRVSGRAAALWMAVAAIAAIAVIILIPHIKRQALPADHDRSQIAFLADKAPAPITISGEKRQTLKVGKETKDRLLDVTSLGANVADVLTVTVPKGDVYTVVLTDGTRVYLHPDSRLRFPTDFLQTERRVELIGEAYFDVAHDAKRPFSVKTQNITTTVLGTEFNVCAYQGSSPLVTLISGSVEVSSGRKKVVIKPGEQSILTDNGRLEVSQVDTDSYTYWRDGFFYYDNISLEEMMIQLGRAYNMSVEFLSPEVKAYKIHFVAKRSEKIDDVIRMINKIDRIHILRKGNLLSVE